MHTSTLHMCIMFIGSKMWDVLLDGQSPHKDGDSSDRGGVREEEEEVAVYRKRGDVHFQPAEFVGPISNILKQFPEGLQIERVNKIFPMQ